MEVPVNYLAVVVATVVSFIFGFLWYGPLFGGEWMKLMGFSKKDMSPEKMKGMQKTYVISFVGSLIMAYVLSHVYVFASTYMNVSGVAAGLSVGFWNWLGFVMPVTLGSVLWDNKPWKLFILNNGYWLGSLAIMGVIIAMWQ